MIPSAIAPWKLSASLFIRAEKVTYFPPVPGGGQRSRYSRSFRPSATFGERRMYGGRMRLVNLHRWPWASTRRSFTRGALTAIVPEPTVTFRVRPLAVADH